jgi:hypothetical protein
VEVGNGLVVKRTMTAEEGLFAISSGLVTYQNTVS